MGALRCPHPGLCPPDRHLGSADLQLPREGQTPPPSSGEAVLAGSKGPSQPSLRRLLLQCITDSTRERKINSSLQLPDRVLNFLKDHFLMDGQVRSLLLLLQPQARYQRVAAHRVRGLHGTYDVLFLGTGECLTQGRCRGPRAWL